MKFPNGETMVGPAFAWFGLFLLWVMVMFMVWLREYRSAAFYASTMVIYIGSHVVLSGSEKEREDD